MNLTPKQKARELVETFYIGHSKDNLPLTLFWNQAKGSCRWKSAKECALICVNEVIKIAPLDKSIFGTQYLTIKEYYERVKIEIEML